MDFMNFSQMFHCQKRRSLPTSERIRTSALGAAMPPAKLGWSWVCQNCPGRAHTSPGLLLFRLLLRDRKSLLREKRHFHLHTHCSPAQFELLHPLIECLAVLPCPRSIRLLCTDTLTENNPMPWSPLALALLPGTSPRTPLPWEHSRRALGRAIHNQVGKQSPIAW